MYQNGAAVFIVFVFTCHQKLHGIKEVIAEHLTADSLALRLSCCRFFYQFLLANERTVAKEIRDEYVDTMSKIYYSYFKSYSGRLLKVQVSGFTQDSTSPSEQDLI